jgi:hypothetical protein
MDELQKYLYDLPFPFSLISIAIVSYLDVPNNHARNFHFTLASFLERFFAAKQTQLRLLDPGPVLILVASPLVGEGRGEDFSARFIPYPRKKAVYNRPLRHSRQF